MALSIKNPKAERLAAEVARETGETMTEAVIVALEERLERLRGRRAVVPLEQIVMEISRRCSELPDVDARPVEELLLWDEHGLPA
ncbi:MAG TPA: type II toxin-antitoxin system VapB family antitoxin [Candidatus Xenobia bacterium]|jgi:antitoxin VapB